MIVKIFKGIWLSSLLATMAVFLYVYASLPESVAVMEGEATRFISRNSLFYSTLGFLAAFNALIFVGSRLFRKSDPYFMAWFYGLIGIFNVFIIVGLQYLNLYNSGEKFNYESIGGIIYGSIVLVVIWSILWPVSLVIRRIATKQQI
jgi:hypothetical protein